MLGSVINAMKSHPAVNALVAALYIAAVASLINFGAAYAETEPGILGPIAFLSLFVVSAAVMGFLFLWRPAQLMTEGKTAESLRSFLSTVAFFALITLVFFISLIVLG